jgi:hypothetical protein
MAIPVSFLHTSPAAIAPLMQYYGAQAPDLEITNQLDDGLLRMLSKGDVAGAERRLGQMLSVAKDQYRARAVMVTCSSVTPRIMQALSANAVVPLMKIDTPMAEQATRASGPLGVVITFRPTLEPTSKLLLDAAARAGNEVELQPAIVTGAYDALLAGNFERHDELLLGAVDDLVARGVNGVVLAQVSMARLLPKLSGRVPVPVYSSLPSSLQRLRELIA